MERLDYKKIVVDIIKDYSQLSIYKGVELHFICDWEKNHYILMFIGWHEWHWHYSIFLHLQIKDGKIWIQHDGTNSGVANDLVNAGVPKEDIVLGFKSPYSRQFVDYAKSRPPEIEDQFSKEIKSVAF